MNTIFHPEALIELYDAARYYNDLRSGLGEEFGTKFELAVKGIFDDPKRWPIHDFGFRKYTMQRYPYTVRYLERQDHIYIVAVPHSSREPGYWRNRISDEQR